VRWYWLKEKMTYGPFSREPGASEAIKRFAHHLKLFIASLARCHHSLLLSPTAHLPRYVPIASISNLHATYFTLHLVAPPTQRVDKWTYVNMKDLNDFLHNYQCVVAWPMGREGVDDEYAYSWFMGVNETQGNSYK
jgi:hypothetical protein